MFGLKKKSSASEVAEVPATPDFVEAKSFYGMSIHVYDTSEEKVVCGYDNPVVTDIEINPEMMRSTIDKQHSGFMWCFECGEAFIGVSAQEFINGRDSR